MRKESCESDYIRQLSNASPTFGPHLGPKAYQEDMIRGSKPSQLDSDSDLIPEDLGQPGKRQFSTQPNIPNLSQLADGTPRTRDMKNAVLGENGQPGIEQQIKLIDKKVRQLLESLKKEYESDKLSKICKIMDDKLLPKRMSNFQDIMSPFTASLPSNNLSNTDVSPITAAVTDRLSRGMSLQSIESSNMARRVDREDQSLENQSNFRGSDKLWQSSQASEVADERLVINMLRINISKSMARVNLHRIKIFLVFFISIFVVLKMVLNKLLLDDIDDLEAYQRTINRISNLQQPTGYYYRAGTYYLVREEYNLTQVNYPQKAPFVGSHVLFYYDLLIEQYDFLVNLFATQNPRAITSEYLSRLE